MEHLTAQLIKPIEAARLGIKSGWYGRKANGTIMTDMVADEKQCQMVISKLTGQRIPTVM
jgi:hypothetical protein